MKLYWLFAVPATLFAQLGASPGSLFTASGRLADPIRDLRASSVGDIVTIIVSDRASALAKGTTNTSRKSSAANTLKSLGGSWVTGNPLGSLVDLASSQQLQGQGQTSRDMTLSTTISARVIEVTANGTLVVEATKDISVNSEKQVVSLSGLVRPYDLTTANTVRSDQVADLTVRVNGKGVVGDAIRRPFFLYRLALALLPF
jgi:flagellar L-ring protein precursor FlgH